MWKEASRKPTKAEKEDARRRALDALAKMTDAEDAAITAAAEADPDNPPLGDLFTRERGRPKLEQPKRAVNLRLDADLVERFKADGPGWQSRMNEALRKAVGL